MQKWSGGRDRKTFFDYYQAILQHQIGKIGHQFQTCDIKSAFCKAAPIWFSVRHQSNLSFHFQGQWENIFFLTEEQFSAGFTLLFRVVFEKYFTSSSSCVCLPVAEPSSSALHGKAGSSRGGMSSVVADEPCEEYGTAPCQSGKNWDHRHVKQPHAKNLNLWTWLYRESLLYYPPLL